MAKLTFYYGVMSSGKTIDLIQTAYKYNSKGEKALVLKPKIDTKGDEFIVSRIGLKKKADIVLASDESILNYSKILSSATCLLVDEAQFLTEEQVLELFMLTKELNLPVICYGLKTDFQGNLFKGSQALFKYADNLEKLKAVCSSKGCINNASFNARKVNGEYIFDGPQVLIGADESYDPLCNDCYIKYVLKPHNKTYIKKYNQIIEVIK